MICLSAISNAQSWNLTGNTATNPVNHFVGTTDNNPLQFGTNNTFPQMILNTNSHIGIGLNHLPGNDVLDILPDANFPNTGIGINNETVLHNWGDYIINTLKL
jgi:hypothetical protein